MKDIESRVMSSYFKTMKLYGDSDMPSRGVEEVVIKGSSYFILCNSYRLLAVYNYIEKKDMLKRMKRIPKDILKMYGEL